MLTDYNSGMWLININEEDIISIHFAITFSRKTIEEGVTSGQIPPTSGFSDWTN